jgi:uncharacterized iron-regulated membrane protein
VARAEQALQVQLKQVAQLEQVAQPERQLQEPQAEADLLLSTVVARAQQTAAQAFVPG